MKNFGEYALHEYLKAMPTQYHFVVSEEKIPKDVIFFSDGITGFKNLLLVGGGMLLAVGLGLWVFFVGIISGRGSGFWILFIFFLVFIVITLAILGMTLYREGKLWLEFIQRRYKYGVFFMEQGLICRGDDKIFVFPYKDIDSAVLETEVQQKPKARYYFIKIEYYDSEDRPYTFRLPLGVFQKLKAQKILAVFKQHNIETSSQK